jgi:pimeloyl-ACP methyl ester carboxylesterase
VVIAGFSLGSMVAAFVASTRPDLVRGLFIEDSPLFMMEEG